MEQRKATFSRIATENEAAATQALARGDFVQAYLQVHTLIEGLLRLFLRIPGGEEVTFNQLTRRYQAHLEEVRFTVPSFIHEVTQLNRRRNQIVEHLWLNGLSATNREMEPAARAAVTMCGLFIDWLESFDPEISELGFSSDDGR